MFRYFSVWNKPVFVSGAGQLGVCSMKLPNCEEIVVDTQETVKLAFLVFPARRLMLSAVFT